MTYVRGLAALTFAFLGQLVLSAAWPSSVVAFDLPLLVVLYYAVDRGPAASLFLGAGVGIVQDSLTGSLLGAGAVSRCLVGYAAGFAGTRFILAKPLPQIVLIGAGTLGARLLEYLTLAVMGRRPAFPPPLDLLAGVVGNVAVGGAAYVILRRGATS